MNNPNVGKKMISNIHRVMPMDLQNKVQDLRDRESKLSWDYGAIANGVYQYILANELPYTRLEACGYVSFMVDNQKAPNTIMRYALVAEFFANKRSWQRYDFLPFSHFELAMRLDGDWRKVLDRSVAIMTTENGRPPSRARLEREFFPDIVEHQLLDTEISYEQKAYMPVLATSETELDDLRNFLVQLQSKLTKAQHHYPRIAPLLAQAALIIRNALEKISESPADLELENYL